MKTISGMLLLLLIIGLRGREYDRKTHLLLFLVVAGMILFVTYYSGAG